VSAGFEEPDTLSNVVERRYREEGEGLRASVDGSRGTFTFSCLRFEMEDEWKDVDFGKWMRWGGFADVDEGESGLCTEIPVVLGDKGIAIMGAGIVCRLRRGDVLYSLVMSVGRAVVVDLCSDDGNVELKPRG
jgi:hypothetical protein